MPTVYCFTSTGNSLFVAKTIAQHIDGQVVPLVIRGDEQIVCGDEVVGLVFPAYFWNTPRMVRRFAQNLRLTHSSPYVFCVVTYGGVIYGISGWLKRELRKAGISLDYSAKIKMVDNYIPLIPPKDSDKLQESIAINTSRVAEEIQQRKLLKPEPLTPPAILWSKLSELLLRANHSTDRHFIVDETCDGCGICKKVCLASNISLETGRPMFHHQCEYCFGCVQACPEQALNWTRLTRGKQRYRNKDVSLRELIEFNDSARQ